MSKQSDLVNIAQGDTITVDHANGRVGIETSSPSARLSIKQINNSTLGGLQVIRSDTTAHGVMYMGGDDALYVQNQANGAMVFYANSAEHMRITSSGNVGIGTSSPSRLLDVNGIAKASIFDAGGEGFIRGDAVGELRIQSGTTATTFRNNANNTDFMRIDSAGNVTKPYQPMFLGYPTNDYSSGGMPTGVMSVTALYNNGGHFNAANSRFTAPVGGWYLTTWGGLQLTNTVTSLMINGVRNYSGNHAVFTGSYSTMTQTAIIFLNAGDYLNIEQWNGGGYYNAWYVWTVTLLG